MMEKLHQAAKSSVAKGALALIMASLLLGGLVGYFRPGPKDYLAVVNGDKISRTEFARIYQAEQHRLQAEWGEAFASLTADPRYFDQLQQKILNSLINQKLLDQYMRQLGIQISDDRIKTEIRNRPEFQKEGRFDNQLYLTLLQQNGYTPEILSQEVRQRLSQQQLFSALLESEFVLPEESNSLFALFMQQREVRLATLAIEPLIAQQPITDQEVTDYYTQHPNDFVEPEQIKINYITFSAETLQSKIKIDDTEIKNYYEQHAARYTVAPRHHISLIRLETEAEAKALLATLQQPGSDFAALAKTKSTDRLSAAKGGVLGWVEPGTTAPLFDQAAFALKNKGQLSEVISTGDGYYILRLDDQQPQRLKTLKEVQKTIAHELQHRKAIEQFYALQQTVQIALKEHPDSWDEIEALTGVKVQKSALFNRNQVPPMLDFQPLINKLFDQTLINSKSHSELIEVSSERAFIVQVEEHCPEQRRSLQQVQPQITTLLQREKATTALRKQAEHILAELRAGNGEKALTAAGLQWGKTQVLNRMANHDQQLTTALFSHPKPASEQAGYGMAETAQGDIVLFQLIKVINGHDPQAEKAFSAQLLELEAGELLHALLNNLHRQAKIKRIDLNDME